MGAIAVAVTAGVGYGIYKMAFDAKNWLVANDRPKAPWERDPGPPTTSV